MKLIITEKQLEKLILREDEIDDITLVSNFCKKWETLKSEEKNKFLQNKDNETSMDLPLDPLILCEKPLSVDWIQDKDRVIFNKLLNNEY